jgi:hypothetical protein
MQLKYCCTGDNGNLSECVLLAIPSVQVNLNNHLPNVQVEIEDGPCGMFSFSRPLILLKYCHTEDNRNLGMESDLPVPAVPANFDEHPPNIHGTLVKSFLKMPNSNNNHDDYNNHTQSEAGESLIFLSAQYTIH